MSEKTQAEITAERIFCEVGFTCTKCKVGKCLLQCKYVRETAKIISFTIDTATAELRAEKEALLDMLQKAMGAECFECHGRVGRENYPDASIRLFHEPDCKVGELLKANGR